MISVRFPRFRFWPDYVQKASDVRLEELFLEELREPCCYNKHRNYFLAKLRQIRVILFMVFT